MRYLMVFMCICLVISVGTEEIQPPPIAHPSSQHVAGMSVPIPERWTQQAGISPKITVWRPPLDDKTQTEYVSKSLTVSLNNDPDTIAEQIAALTTIIQDLYAETIIHQAVPTTENALKLPHLEYEFRIGQTHWRQLVIFIAASETAERNALVIVLSGPEATWTHWNDQRSQFLALLRKQNSL